MKLIETFKGYDIYKLTNSESIMRGKPNCRFVVFLSGDNFLTVGYPYFECESLKFARIYCSDYPAVLD